MATHAAKKQQLLQTMRSTIVFDNSAKLFAKYYHKHVCSMDYFASNNQHTQLRLQDLHMERRLMSTNIAKGWNSPIISNPEGQAFSAEVCYIRLRHWARSSLYDLRIPHLGTQGPTSLALLHRCCCLVDIWVSPGCVAPCHMWSAAPHPSLPTSANLIVYKWGNGGTH